MLRRNLLPFGALLWLILAGCSTGPVVRVINTPETGS